MFPYYSRRLGNNKETISLNIMTQLEQALGILNGLIATDRQAGISMEIAKAVDLINLFGTDTNDEVAATESLVASLPELVEPDKKE